jgi:hypothetical protein
MSASDSEEVLEMFLAGRTPVQQARLKVAWEKYAGGNPESAPAVYAMAQLFVIDAQASALDRQAELLAEFREVCEEQRLIFQSAVSQESKAILDGFEKRQAIFEQKQHLATENPSVSEVPHKACSLLPMVLAAVIGMIGGGYAMNQYKEKQFQAEKSSSQSTSVKSAHER